MNWTQDKAALNHDWLKNRLLVILGSLDNVINGRVRDDFVFKEFHRLLLEWTVKRREIHQLLERYPVEMSPRSLFKRAPLNACSPQVMAWLPDLIDDIWHQRHPVKIWLKDAAENLKMTDQAIQECLRCLPEVRQVGTSPGLGSNFAAAVAALHNTCYELSASLSCIPNHQLI